VTGHSRATALACAAAMLATVSVAGCGQGGDPDKAAGKTGDQEMKQAADVTTCRADAKPLDRPYGAGFPERWPFPPRTTVYHYENRAASGSIVTAVSSAGFRTVLAFMNHDVANAGFKVESGETEEHDAEAEWAGNGYRGRWAIKESATCPGQTVVQVLAGVRD
jgi:hypothetical protein